MYPDKDKNKEKDKTNTKIIHKNKQICLKFTNHYVPIQIPFYILDSFTHLQKYTTITFLIRIHSLLLENYN